MIWPLQVGSISSQCKAIWKSLKKYGDLSCSLEAYLEDALGGKIWMLLYGRFGTKTPRLSGQEAEPEPNF